MLIHTSARDRDRERRFREEHAGRWQNSGSTPTGPKWRRSVSSRQSIPRRSLHRREVALGDCQGPSQGTDGPLPHSLANSLTGSTWCDGSPGSCERSHMMGAFAQCSIRGRSRTSLLTADPLIGEGRGRLDATTFKPRDTTVGVLASSKRGAPGAHTHKQAFAAHVSSATEQNTLRACSSCCVCPGVMDTEL